MYDFLTDDAGCILEAARNVFYGTEPVAIDRFEKVRFDSRHYPDEHFGFMVNQHWRDFLVSLYYADILSYPHRQDQVDFPRLCYLVNAFPQGFTLWQATVQDKTYPVGYCGWYYVEQNTFDYIVRMPFDRNCSITSRFFLPAQGQTPYLYLFNYSITPALNHSPYSHALMDDFREELAAIDYRGLFCAAVSADGVRIAQQFGMHKVGSLTSADGCAGDTLYMYP
ncbi:MAG: hypothetical protein LBO67_08890 [Spirochaetaceae bacterium]|jgi:hypothetical protein|nr:hypothetical protein [Spirochaetaceae bacterium]